MAGSANTLTVDYGEWTGRHHHGSADNSVRAKLQTFIFLSGRQVFQIDGKTFDIDAGNGLSVRPKALTFSLAQMGELKLVEADVFPLRKVSLAANPVWLEQVCDTAGSKATTLRGFLSGHLNHQIWEPSLEALQHIRTIAAPRCLYASEMTEFMLMARGMDLLSEVCGHLQQDELVPTETSSAIIGHQMERVRSYIFDNLGGPLTLETIAANTGTSLRSLQRHFRRHFGMTVFEFIRTERLELARVALQKSDIGVAQAAYLAGYENASSFSSAYKRQFGMSPKFQRS